MAEVLVGQVALFVHVQEVEYFRNIFSGKADPSLLEALLQICPFDFAFASLVQEAIGIGMSLVALLETCPDKFDQLPHVSVIRHRFFDFALITFISCWGHDRVHV